MTTDILPWETKKKQKTKGRPCESKRAIKLGICVENKESCAATDEGNQEGSNP
jgi:hypothetical protein